MARSTSSARPSRILTIRGVLFNMGRIILLSEYEIPYFYG
jgi:hypothetical protein